MFFNPNHSRINIKQFSCELSENLNFPTRSTICKVYTGQIHYATHQLSIFSAYLDIFRSWSLSQIFFSHLFKPTYPFAVALLGKHSVKAENNLRKTLLRTFSSPVQAEGAGAQCPKSLELTHSPVVVVQPVPHTAGSNPGARGGDTHTQFRGAWMSWNTAGWQRIPCKCQGSA